jgi:hypothetical protein
MERGSAVPMQEGWDRGFRPKPGQDNTLYGFERGTELPEKPSESLTALGESSQAPRPAWRAWTKFTLGWLLWALALILLIHLVELMQPHP